MNISVVDNYNVDTILIRLYNSSHSQINATNASAYNATSSFLYINFTGLSDGVYYINATVNDTTGNSNESSTYTITLDNAGPSTVNFADPTPTAYSNLSQTSIPVNISVTDVTLWVDTIQVDLHNSSHDVISSGNTTLNASSGSYFINFTSLSDDTYYINATVNDTLSQYNYSATRTILLDTTYPTIENGTQTPVEYANLSQSSLYVNVSFTEANFYNITFTLLNDTGVVNFTTYASATYDINWTGLVDSNYSYEVNITDIAGNTNTTGLRYVNLDYTTPVVSYGTQTSVAYANLSQESIYVNVSVTERTLQTINFTLYNDTGIVNSTAYSTATYFINWSSLANNNYTYVVNVTDLTSHVGTSGIRYVLLDTGKPTSMNLIEPADAISSTLNVYNFTFNVSDTYNIHNCSLILNGLVDTALMGITTDTTMGIFRDSLAAGVYTWSMNCSDYSGNTQNTSTRTLTVAANPSNTVSGGSGGGLVSTVSESQLANGYDALLYRNWKSTFKSAGKTHTLTVKKIEENTVTIEISSTPQTAILSVGETKFFDLNGDDVKDIQVTFNEIKDNKASLTIKSVIEKTIRSTKIAEEPSVEEEKEVASETPEVREIEENLQETRGISWLVVGMIFVVLAIIVLIVVLTFRQKKSKKK